MVHKRIGKKDLVDVELNGKQSTLSNFGFITKNVTKATKKLKKSGKQMSVIIELLLFVDIMVISTVV
jgi:hypothetical protein